MASSGRIPFVCGACGGSQHLNNWMVVRKEVGIAGVRVALCGECHKRIFQGVERARRVSLQDSNWEVFEIQYIFGVDYIPTIDGVITN